MNKNKLSALLFYVAALLFYVAAVFGFVGKEHTGVMYLCMGSAMGCFGSANLNKYKKNADNSDNRSEDKTKKRE